MDCRGNLGSVWDITRSLITTAAAIFPAKYKKTNYFCTVCFLKLVLI